jgi:hypothetical protein
MANHPNRVKNPVRVSWELAEFDVDGVEVIRLTIRN